MTVADLLNFIAANRIPSDSEIQVIRNHTADPPITIDVEAMSVLGLDQTAEGLLRIDVS